MVKKIITANAFTCAIDVDESGKIVRVPKILHQAIGWNVPQLMEALCKNKFQSFKFEDGEEIE